MPKYNVKMRCSISKETSFVVDAKDPDELHELLGNIDSNILENIVEWTCHDYQPPEIIEYEKVHKDTAVNVPVSREMKRVRKAWEAL